MMRETPSATAKRHRRFQPRQVPPLRVPDPLQASIKISSSRPCTSSKGMPVTVAQSKSQRPHKSTHRLSRRCVATTLQPANGGDQGQRVCQILLGHTGHTRGAGTRPFGPTRMPITQTSCPASHWQLQELWVRDAATCGGLEVHKPPWHHMWSSTGSSHDHHHRCPNLVIYNPHHSGQHMDIAS